MMICEFYVLMRKRSDCKQYADLHKSTQEIFLLEEDADSALWAMGEIAIHFATTKMVALLACDWEEYADSLVKVPLGWKR